MNMKVPTGQHPCVCCVCAGDGWSARAEDSILHGCVPVLVMDYVQPIWDGVLDWDSFSVRIAVSGALTRPVKDPPLASCIPAPDFAS